MTKVNDMSGLKEEFAQECKAINLKYEYPGYEGTERFGLITALSGDELEQKYGRLLDSYRPFAILPLECGEVMADFRKNEYKHKKRSQLYGEAFAFDDGQSPAFHNELCSYDLMCWEREERERNEAEMLRTLSLLREGMTLLTEVQKRRVNAVFFEGKTSREVAEEEGVNYSKVDKSISQSLKKLKVFLENRGCKTPIYSK